MSNKKDFNNYVSGPVVGVDNLGRTLPTLDNSRPLRKDRYVGMFYFLCNGEHGNPEESYICNVSEVLAIDPQAGYKPDSPLWGTGPVVHYWGEPLYGYYLSKDEWVIRKHVEMLTLADIDFLIFDTTNGHEYLNVVTKLMKALDEARLDGWKVPQIAYFTNTNAGEAAQRIYETVYMKNLYPELWFKVDGKPLLVTHEAECSEELRKYFTVRQSQWPNEADRENSFPWISFIRPQKIYYDRNGNNGVMSVAVAQHPQVFMGDSAMYGETANWGRSYHDGDHNIKPGSANNGYNIQEQWEHAYQEDPEMVFVTGWNEWTFGRYHYTEERPITFVDNADQEYSRDIEPMRGGHFDNYYMQLIGNVRQYKGTCETPNQSKHNTIDINAEFTQWNKISVTYKDFTNSINTRDEKGFGKMQYKNHTVRNEFDKMKVAHDDEFIYFYVKTKLDIMPQDKSSTWMNLYIKTENLSDENWNGYNFIANYNSKNENKSSLAKSKGGNDWEEIADIAYSKQGDEMMISIPKKFLGIQQNFEIQFKWADANVKLTSIEDFYELGDTAPFGRLNYLFSSRS